MPLVPGEPGSGVVLLVAGMTDYLSPLSLEPLGFLLRYHFPGQSG